MDRAAAVREGFDEARSAARPVWRSVLLLTLTLTLGLFAACGGEHESPDAASAPSPAGELPLNLLFITLDTTRADALSLYGSERRTTPEIDRLGASGVVFEQAYTTQPSTLPSHSTMMTGRLPFAHGARANAGYVLAYDNETLAEVFGRNGYVTAAEIAATVIGRRTQLDQGFQHYRDLQSFDIRRKAVQVTRDGEKERQELPERDAVDITRRGIEFLRRHADEPFFLWLHYFDPHSFYAPPIPWNSRFPDSPYHAEIHFADYNIGRVIEELRKLGLDERTIVVFTSDHGEGLDEHEELSHSYYVYDTTMRVPLVIALPGTVEGGRRIQQPVRTADLAPTVLELAGLPPLDDIQGVSLAPLLLGKSTAPVLDVYGESFEPLAMFGANVLRFIRRGDWKYIHKVEPELYDLSSDPSELQNLAAENPERVAELRSALESWVREGLVQRDDNRVYLDEEELAQLHALGYMGEGAPTGFDELDDIANLRGVDPVSRIGDMELYAGAFAAMKVEDYDRAKDLLEQVYARNPESLPILRGLINTLRDEERLERAPGLLDKAKELEPDNPNNFIRAGEVQLDLGNFARATAEMQQALVVDPCNVPARVVFAEMLNGQGRFEEQRVLLEAGIAQCDNVIDFRNDLAYLLATAPDDAVRDGREALRLAKRIVAEMETERPDYLDTLACAWAEVGNFRNAVRESRRAIELLESRDLPEEMIAAYTDHLELFEAGKTARGNG